MKYICLLLIASIANAEQAPRRFHDGEILHMEGAEITIRKPPDGPCLSATSTGLLSSGSGSCSSAPGFFQVHVLGAMVNRVEITVGRASYLVLDAKIQKISVLKFETFTSQGQLAIDTAMGMITDLDSIRTIDVKLSMLVEEKIFR